MSEKINFKLSNSFFLFITKFGFIPTLFVIMVLAIISPSLSIMLDLNSFVIKFVLNVFFVNELRNTALIERGQLYVACAYLPLPLITECLIVFRSVSNLCFCY